VEGVHALQVQHMLFLLVVKIVISLCRGIITVSFFSWYSVCQQKLGGLSLVNLFSLSLLPFKLQVGPLCFLFFSFGPLFFFLAFLLKFCSFQFSPLIPICHVSILSLFF